MGGRLQNAVIIKVNITGDYPTLYQNFEDVNDSFMVKNVRSMPNHIQKNETTESPGAKLMQKLTKGIQTKLQTEFTSIE